MSYITKKYKQTLNKIDRRSWSLLAVHGVIFFFFLVIMNSFFLHFEKGNTLVQKQNQLYSLEHDIKVIKTQSDYLNKGDFKEQQAKNLNYKKEGEQVLSTLNIEDSEDELKSYIPSKNYEDLANITIWYNCFVNPSQDCLD